MAAHPIAVLKLSPRIKNVITFAQAVYTAVTGNAYFPSPNPPLATLDADIAALNAAETAVLSRVKGAVEARDAKLAIVKNDLGVMRTYVQSIADANPSNAATIIESAGMKVRTVTLHDKPALSVKLGDVSGSVLLAAKAAADRAAYDWQYSTDQKTWTEAPQTLKAKTRIAGLTAGTTYYFRVQSLIRAGEQNWSQVVSLLVA